MILQNLKRKLKNLKKKSSYDVVLDLSFGDNGKGRVVDWLSGERKNPLVIRFNGGHQAGHHVIHNKISHVFSNFGSGTLRGVPTYWSKHCTVDPEGLLKELGILIGKGIDPEIFISSHAPVTTPLDKEFNQNQELITKHGSVGVGFGTTIKREQDHYSFKFLDIFYEPILLYKIRMVEKYYNKKTDWKKFLGACEELREDFYDYAVRLHIGTDIPDGFDSYIYESAQGLLLDQDLGFFPHVTRSNTGMKNISLPESAEPTVWIVTRAYQTRHGTGPMTNLDHYNNEFILENKYEQNKMHVWQGNFRKTVLDLSLLEYSFNIHKLKNVADRRLVITCVDNLKKYCLTYCDIDYEFDTLKEFVEMIAHVLETSKVYISRSPEGTIYKFS